MADNYTQFSTLIYGLTDEERAWCEKYFRLCEKFCEIDEDFEYSERNAQFDYSFEEASHQDKTAGLWTIGLWMYSEECGSPESVAVFVQSFLRRWRPEDSFTFRWAGTCSKPRIDEFCGGTICVTKDEIRSCDGSCVVPKKEGSADE